MSVTKPASVDRAASLRELRRRSATARAIVRAWRGIVGSGREHPVTLVACSGGADSSALAIALSTATRRLVIGHIMHDLRSREAALADRDAARDLAASLELPFVSAEISVGAGNAEAGARLGRYRALARLARECQAPLVATAHHADDQLESMVMALVRGAGPAGLRGVAAARPLGPGVTLIRPMLAVTRTQARALCELAGVGWMEDKTNSDTSRLRAALRHGPLAALSELRPQGAVRAARSSLLLRDATTLLQHRAQAVFGSADSWSRQALRAELPAVIGEGLRRAATRLAKRHAADRLTGRVVDPALRAILDENTNPRHFDWPGDLHVEVRARVVSMSARPQVSIGE